eukprot:EG_transcript_9631
MEAFQDLTAEPPPRNPAGGSPPIDFPQPAYSASRSSRPPLNSVVSVPTLDLQDVLQQYSPTYGGAERGQSFSPPPSARRNFTAQLPPLRGPPRQTPPPLAARSAVRGEDAAADPQGEGPRQRLKPMKKRALLT